MGSITSRPKAPVLSVPQTVFIPAPSQGMPIKEQEQHPTAFPTESSTGSGGSSDPQMTHDEAVQKQRVESLLQRNRGRLGTILTSFRGILAPAQAHPVRKTLLGE